MPKQRVWEHTCFMDLNCDGEKEKYELEIYQYSDLSLVFISPELFGKSFSKHLKTAASFNPNLDFDGKKTEGWVYSLKKQEEFNEVIQGILSRKFEPKKVYIRQKNETHELWLKIKELAQLSETKENGVYVVPDDEDDIVTTLIYGKRDFVTEKMKSEGNYIFDFQTAHSRVVVCQNHVVETEED